MRFTVAWRWLACLNICCLTAAASAQSIQPIYSFNSAKGPAELRAGLTLDSAGNFYGTTYSGGTEAQDVNFGNDSGTVFKITPNGTLVMLLNFAGLNATGYNPLGGMAVGPDGYLYGTTSAGGSGGNGTVFRVRTNGAFSTVANFTLGACSRAGLTMGPDGNFYGTTYAGGSTELGTVFRVTTNGTITTLVSFTGPNGANPYVGLTLAPDGNFYGTTRYGGSGGIGTAFRIGTNGSLTTLSSFGAAVGANPMAGLALGPDGNFYGTTQWGGSNNAGTIFRMTINGVLTRQFSFAGTNGAYPKARLTLAPDGNFYGTTTTLAGGTDGGTVFRFSINGGLTTLASFLSPDGADLNELTLGLDGKFYGTTLWGGGGPNDGGTVFQVTTNGTVTSLVSFVGTNGNWPYAGLALGPDGNFYGTTRAGGSNDSGTVFRVTTNGSLTTVMHFAAPGPTGANPWADLKWGPDGNLYGTTTGGGSSGNGTVFRMTTNGVLTTMANFGGYATGAFPLKDMAWGPDGNLYGMTYGGGADSWPSYGGIVFKMTTGGALTTLVKFVDTSLTNGGSSEAGLTLGPDGNFYGAATRGGDFNGNGTVFRVRTNGALTGLVVFAGGTNGSAPKASLTLGADGNFFGTTSSGGVSDHGTVFKITTNGLLTTLVSFAGTNGSRPEARLTQGPDGAFYGTTYMGGSNDKGTVFKVTTNGVLTTLANFANTNGANPWSSLTFGVDGNLYGTTQNGGAGGGGVIYRLSLPPTITGQPADQTVASGATADFEVSATGPSPLGYKWYFNNTVTGLNSNRLIFGPAFTNRAGNYQVVVTNAWGSATSRVATLTVLPGSGDYPISRSADGSIALVLPTVSGSTNRLWATTNCSLPMAQWQVIATNVATNGLFKFKDLITSNGPVRFYRLSRP